MSKLIRRDNTAYKDYCIRCGARITDKYGNKDEKAVVLSGGAYYCRRCLNIVARRATQ